jgi:AcrR family transcriptional regulator
MKVNGTHKMKTPAHIQYHHGDLRSALIRTSAGTLRTQEPRELSLREIAKVLGVSTAAPYNHFKDKEDLLNAVADEGFQALLVRFEKAIVRVRPGRGRITAIVKAYLRFSREEPGYYKVMFQSAASREHQEPGGRSFADQALNVVLGAIHSTVTGITPQQARERAIVLCSVVHGLVSLDSAGPFTKLPNPDTLERLAVDAGLRLVQKITLQQISNKAK